MKYNLIVGILTLMTCAYCYSQSSVEAIAIELCNNLEEIDLNRPDEEVIRESLQTISITYQNLQNQIYDLLPEYAKIYENKSDLEISRLIGIDMMYLLMKNCTAFQRMTMFDNQPVPEISPEIEEIGKYFTKLLKDKTANSLITQEIVNDCLDEVFNKYVANSDTDFIIKFDVQFNAYLLTRCDPYMKWLASKVEF